MDLINYFKINLEFGLACKNGDLNAVQELLGKKEIDINLQSIFSFIIHIIQI